MADVSQCEVHLILVCVGKAAMTVRFGSLRIKGKRLVVVGQRLVQLACSGISDTLSDERLYPCCHHWLHRAVGDGRHRRSKQN